MKKIYTDRVFEMYCKEMTEKSSYWWEIYIMLNIIWWKVVSTIKIILLNLLGIFKNFKACTLSLRPLALSRSFITSTTAAQLVVPFLSSSDLTPIEEPEKDSVRSPKRHGSTSTVYDRVKAKLSRSLSTSSASASASASPVVPTKSSALKASGDNSARRLSVGKLSSSVVSADVKLRSPNVLRNGRRCQSEVTSASTAELLAQFVASRW